MKKVLEAVAERMIAAEGIGVSARDLGVANAMVDYGARATHDTSATPASSLRQTALIP